MTPIVNFIAALVVLVAIADPPAAFAQDRIVTVFAAASMKNALDDVNAAFARSTGIKVVASYAASSTLIKQIEQGTPADGYLAYLCSTAAKAIFEQYGFTFLIRPTS